MHSGLRKSLLQFDSARSHVRSIMERISRRVICYRYTTFVWKLKLIHLIVHIKYMSYNDVFENKMEKDVLFF